MSKPPSVLYYAPRMAGLSRTNSIYQKDTWIKRAVKKSIVDTLTLITKKNRGDHYAYIPSNIVREDGTYDVAAAVGRIYRLRVGVDSKWVDVTDEYLLEYKDVL